MDTEQQLTSEPEDERRPTAEEVAAFQARYLLAGDDDADAEAFPRMFNISAGFVMKKVIRAEVPDPPQYVALPMLPADDGRIAFRLAIAEWNRMWEAAQYRRRAVGDLPPAMERLAELGDHNVVFVPRTSARYYEYAALYHLIPAQTLRRFGLPLLRAGQWPFTMEPADVDRHLPGDFSTRLERAWAATVWRHLVSGSPMRAFSGDDPIRLLAHNLDFWVPPADGVIRNILEDFPIGAGRPDETEPAVLEDGSVLPGALLANPRMGGDLWRGEEWAGWVVEDVVEQADATGRLRGILDAVRSHRAEDDFSGYWSNAREDFERKLYRKRSKVKVTFVELPDTIPVPGPETHVVGNMVHADFLTLLNPKDREIVVLLTSGMTKLTEIAEELGYANHSAVSKRLARIRRQAAAYFDSL